MIHELNAHSISEWILKEDKEMLPKMTPKELWYHIQSYTDNDIELDYVYDRLVGEVKK